MTIEFLLASGVLIGIGACVTSAVARWTGQAKRLWIVYVAHLAGSIGLYVAQVVPQPDAELYHRLAVQQVDYWSGRAVFEPTFTDGKEGWMMVLAVAYQLLGPHLLFGCLINAIVATATTGVLMKTCERLGWPLAAPMVAWLMLLPGFMLWSSLALREAFVWLFTALAVWAAAGFVTQASRVRSAAALAVAIFVGLFFRGSVVAVLLAGLAVGVFLARRRASKAAVMACLGGLLVAAGPGLAFLEGTSIGGSLDQVNRSRSSLSTAGSGFETQAYQGLDSVISSLPSTLLRVAVGPYPSELLTLPTASVVAWFGWIALLVLAVRGRRALGRGRWLLAAPALSLSLVLAATSGNYGTMIRLREQVGIILVPLAAAGLTRAYRHRSGEAAKRPEVEPIHGVARDARRARHTPAVTERLR